MKTTFAAAAFAGVAAAAVNGTAGVVYTTEVVTAYTTYWYAHQYTSYMARGPCTQP